MSEADHVSRARVRARQQAQRNGTDSRRPPADQPGGPEPPPPELGIRLSTVKPERVAWLWHGRIPLGKLTILDGDPGLGKSVLTMDIAARVSAGEPMPFDAQGEPGEGRKPAGVVLLTAEDGLADTVYPRLEAAGADLERIIALETVPGDPPRPPRLPDDIHWLAKVVKQAQAELVVIDPLMAFLGEKVNAHHDQDVRRALHPLAKMAEKTGAAVVVVRHLNKATGGNPLYRGGGSIGIIGAARSGMLLARDPDDPDRRILASTKCNLARLPSSLIYSIESVENGAIRVCWIGESTHSAESLLAAPVDAEDRGAVQDAVDVLRSLLAAGQQPCDSVKAQARGAGISNRTLHRAKAILGVCSRRIGFGNAGVWFWGLPESAGVP